MVRVWIAEGDVQQRTRFTVLETCKTALDAAGIEIPFPHLQLFLEQTEALAPLVRLAGGGAAD
jgi:small-conductance mechanosensitive channel